MSTEETQKFIIVFKDGVTADQIDKYTEQVCKTGGNVDKDKTWYMDGGIINGFAAAITPSFLQSLQEESLAPESVISYIERDGIVTTQ